jgi:hypothetical protein
LLASRKYVVEISFRHLAWSPKFPEPGAHTEIVIKLVFL